MKPALLVIDMQKAYYGDPTKASMDTAADCINRLLALFREKSFPVYWIHQTGGKGPFEGQPDFEFIDRLDKKEGEPRIVKRYGNSFNKTNLFEQLKKQAVDTVFVTGFCAEQCVLSTYRGAQDLDLKAILVQGASASPTAENIRFTESISGTVTIDEAGRLLGEGNH